MNHERRIASSTVRTACAWVAGVLLCSASAPLSTGANAPASCVANASAFCCASERASSAIDARVSFRADASGGLGANAPGGSGANAPGTLGANASGAFVASASEDEPAKTTTRQDDVEKEIVQLFGKVEARLREIDRLLYQAGAGDRSSLERVGASGMDQLLQRTHQSGRSVVDDIDHILELVKELPGQPSSSSSGQDPSKGDKSQGQSALDHQQGATTERESTPSAPEPGAPKGSEQAGSKPSESKPQGNDGSPRDPRASDDPNPKTAPGKPQTAGPTGAVAGTLDGRDRWGDLPIHARDVFRIEGGGDMPVRYRDWIDSYYKKLNKQP